MTALVTGATASLFGPITPLADAAVRGLAAALTVASGIAIFRVRNVVAQKAAWTVVLSGALLMPLVTPWFGPWLERQSWFPSWLPSEAAVASQIRTRSHIAFASAESWLESMRAQREALAATPTASPAREIPSHETPAREIPAPAVSASTTPVVEQSSVPSELTGPLGPQFPAPVADPVAQSRTAAAQATVQAAVALYLVVAFALLIRLFYGLGAAMRLWRDGEPVQLADTQVPVRVHGEIASPVTIGSGILLPADYAEWDETKLRIVLAHEGSHVRQRDFYLQLAAGLYAAIFWFSPLGWWLKRRLSDLSEAISDRAALDHAASRASYAQILLEFASQPRTTHLETKFGVAMARTACITQRIEWLLNETRFRQAFSGGRARMLAAALLAPVAVFAATALVRVEAKAQNTTPQQQQPAPAQTPAPAQAPTTGVSHPDSAPIETAPAPDAAPVAVPAPTAEQAPVPPAVVLAPIPPIPPISPEISVPAVAVHPDVNLNTNVHVRADTTSYGRGYAYAYGNDQANGDSYAVITKDGRHMRFNGDYHTSVIDKARAQAHGDFLWFTRDGKEYIVDDPEVLARIHAIYQSMDALGEQMKELGKQQKDEAERNRAELDRLMADSGFNNEEIVKQMAEFRAREPEFKKEMAELSAEMANMRKPVKITPVDQAQLDEIKRQMAQLQATEPDFNKKLSELIGKMVNLEVPKVEPFDQQKMTELSQRMAEISKNFADDQARAISNSVQYKIDARLYSQMAEKMAKVGADQGKLGGEMGRMAHDADQQIRSIIDESLKNGKARPVQ
jgi:beta-lactamase regulating signal transducer with metallopeptidase domain